MPPAARINDTTNHPGSISPPGVPTVLIGDQPAATVGSVHVCGFPPPRPHPPNPIVSGSATVLIGGQPAARLGDSTACGAQIISGLATVLIGD